MSLQVRGVGKSFGDFRALHDVHVDVEPGQVHGLIGPNGAGKSTLLAVVAGGLAHDGGSVLLDGATLPAADARARARAGIVMQCQIPAVFESLRVADNLHVAAGAPGRRRGRGPTPADVVDLVRLGSVLERRASELAHGQRKWLELGMCLLAAPRYLLLDEPTAGMTIAERAATADVLRHVLGEGLVEGMLLVEHDMQFVELVCARISVLHRGSVLASGGFGDLAADEAVQEAYLGAH